MTYTCVITHTFVCHDLYMSAVDATQRYVSCHTRRLVMLPSTICSVSRRICTYAHTRTHANTHGNMRTHTHDMCSVTRCVRHGSCMSVPWLIHVGRWHYLVLRVRDKIHACVRHDAYMCCDFPTFVPWLVHVGRWCYPVLLLIDTTHLRVCHAAYVRA